VLVLYKTTDRLKVNIEGVTLEVSPLTFDQKMKITSCYDMSAGEMTPNAIKQTFLAVKYSVKSIEGVKLQDGSNYQVTYEKDGDQDVLTDDCASDLLNLPIGPKMMVACSQLINGVNEEINKIEGVELVMPKSPISKKK